jgi:hypothetical protein
MKRTKQGPPKLPTPALIPEPAPAAAQPPPGMMDLKAARFWAGRDPDRKNRPAYSKMGMGDDLPID